MTKGMTAFYLLLTLVGGIAIIVSLVNIMFVHGDEWRERGLKREAGLRTDPARRGIIYSSDGKILATTVTECDFYLDLLDTIVLDKGKPKLNSKGQPVESGIADSCFQLYLDTICLMLSDANPSRSAAYYRDRISAERAKENPRRCFLVERRIPYSTWLAISRLPGWRVGVVKQVDGRSVVRQVRAHIYGNMAENTIGFLNARDKDTYTGLEGAYDSILRGQDGIFNCRRLTKGIWLPDEPRERKEVPQRTDNDQVDTIVVQNKVDGQSIVSTIDTRYQDIAEHALRSALAQYGGEAGCAVLMEMETGYVMACANLAIDTHAHSYLECRDKNVSVMSRYEPGSTFKTVALTAMMNDPTLTLDTTLRVKTVEKTFPGNCRFVDSHKKRDSLSVREVIEESSNVGMAELGWLFYRDRRDDLVTLMQTVFPYEKLSLDVNAPEPESYINNVHASNRDFLLLTFGYSTAVTPMQILTFYNAVAAGGRMVKPLFCRAVIDGKGHRREIDPVVLRKQAFSEESAKKMKEMLIGVVDHGTAKGIKTSLYSIAGKTGTANYRVSMPQYHNASFAGFFPAENPRYTCYVMLEKVPRIAFGSQAAKVFKEIADGVVAMDSKLNEGVLHSALPQLEIDSTKLMQQPALEKGDQEGIAAAYALLGQQYRSSDPTSRWVYYRSATDSVPGSYVPYEPAEGKVPNCYGMSAKDAVALLRSMGYRARVAGYGKVVSQQPKSGTPAKAGVTVVLNLK